jgi:hypothetical protein
LLLPVTRYTSVLDRAVSMYSRLETVVGIWRTDNITPLSDSPLFTKKVCILATSHVARRKDVVLWKC